MKIPRWRRHIGELNSAIVAKRNQDCEKERELVDSLYTEVAALETKQRALKKSEVESRDKAADDDVLGERYGLAG